MAIAKRAKEARRNRISEEALRDYLEQMTTAYSRLQQGNATGFQRRYLLMCSPMIMELTRAMATETPTSETGQIVV